MCAQANQLDGEGTNRAGGVSTGGGGSDYVDRYALALVEPRRRDCGHRDRGRGDGGKVRMGGDVLWLLWSVK